MLRPAASALPCHQLAWVATTWPAPSNRSDSRAQSASMSSSSASHSLTRSSRALAQRSSNTTAFLASNDRRHQPRPVRAEFGGDQVDQLGVGGRRRRADRRRPDPSWPSTRRAAEASTPSRPVICSANSPSAAASTVAPPPPPADGSATAIPRRAATAATAASMTLSTGGGVGQRTLVQAADGAAANAAALAGAQRDLDGDVLGPAVAELPGLLDPLGDGRGPLARRAEHRAQLVVDRVGQAPGRTACRCGPAWSTCDFSAARSASAAPSIAPRFSSEPRSTSSWLRRDDAPSVIDSMESSGSIWSMRILADSAINASVASAASNAMSSGRGAPEERGGGRSAAGAALRVRRAVRRPRTSAGIVRLGLGLRIGVGGEQHRGVALGVEHFHCAVGVFGQLQGVGGQARRRSARTSRRSRRTAPHPGRPRPPR